VEYKKQLIEDTQGLKTTLTKINEKGVARKLRPKAQVPLESIAQKLTARLQ